MKTNDNTFNYLMFPCQGNIFDKMFCVSVIQLTSPWWIGCVNVIDN